MSNLGDLLDKMKKQEDKITEDIDTDLIDDIDCLYLTEDGLCSEGCSCQGVDIEQACPFIETAEYDLCCCYTPADDIDDDDFEEEDDFE